MRTFIQTPAIKAYWTRLRSRDPEPRFWSKVKKTKTCWLWVPRIGKGYGGFSINRKFTSAHKYSYELVNGKVPKGKVLDHLCRIRWCVNPKHLEVVTHKINLLRGEGIPAKNAKKTHCINGHILDKKVKLGRACSVCMRINSRRYRDKWLKQII